MRRNAFFERIKRDESFRLKVLLGVSLAFNLVYCLYLFVISQLFLSRWFFVMSVYYAFLSIVRSICFAQVYSNKGIFSKIKALRICGIFLLLINLVVSTMMFILSAGNQVVKHHEITVITLATYTFYSLTMAIVSSVKYIKQQEHIFSCAKIINLVSASVSLVTLTNTMLATWGGEEVAVLRSVVLPALCGVVAVFIIVCAILMIRKANLDLRTLRNEKEG